MLPLAAAGYYVVAPDQRGYGRPTGWDDEYDGDVDSFAFRTWSGTRWGSSRHSAIAPSRPWSDTLGLAGRGVLRSVEARRIPFSSIDECPVRRTAAAAVQYRGGRDAGPKRRRGARQSLRRPCEASIPHERITNNIIEHARLTTTCGKPRKASTPSCAPIIISRAPTGSRTSRSSSPHSPPVSSPRCRLTTLWISTRAWRKQWRRGNAVRGRDCRLQVASGRGAGRVRNRMGSDRLSGRFAVV